MDMLSPVLLLVLLFILSMHVGLIPHPAALQSHVSMFLCDYIAASSDWCEGSDITPSKYHQSNNATMIIMTMMIMMMTMIARDI